MDDLFYTSSGHLAVSVNYTVANSVVGAASFHPFSFHLLWRLTGYPPVFSGHASILYLCMIVTVSISCSV